MKTNTLSYSNKSNHSDFGFSRKKIGTKNITFSNSNLTLDITLVRMSTIDMAKNIRLPNKLSPLLAEEIGIHLGDGFLSSKRYDYRLKGHKIDERWYYLDHLKYLYKNLYNIDLSIKNYEDTIGFEIYSQALWDFKVKVLGIKPSPKNNLTIPDIIKVNNEQIITSFLRGFFDTDGSVSFLTKYGKMNYYPVISLTQKSSQIVEEVAQILQMLGFNPHVYHHRCEYTVVLNGYSQLFHFERTIGWNSPKHLNKIARWKQMFDGGHGLMVRMGD